MDKTNNADKIALSIKYVKSARTKKHQNKFKILNEFFYSILYGIIPKLINLKTICLSKQLH